MLKNGINQNEILILLMVKIKFVSMNGIYKMEF
jgi:hypothetical protein